MLEATFNVLALSPDKIGTKWTRAESNRLPHHCK